MKKKIVSMLLALTLVVTGVPSSMTTDIIYAAEAIEDDIVFSDEAEEADGVMKSADESLETLHSEADGLYVVNVAENGKAVGTDGVVYDDVVYLSADTVRALNTNAQSEYTAFCDDIAAARKAGSGLEDAVVAVDENGTLVFYYTIPAQEIFAAMDDLAKDFLESVETEQSTETEQQEIEEADNKTEAEKSETEEEINTEELRTEEEVSAEELSTEEIEEEFTEGNSDEEVLTEETVSEIFSSEETLTEENPTEEIKSVTEEETEAVSEEMVLTAENMELIPELEEERFDVIENVKADIIVDLGYDSSEIQQINSIMPSKDWFSSQLTKNQQIIYKACMAMGKGTNRFKFSATNRLREEDFYQAVSAYIMTEPYKCDWMDLSALTGRIKIIAWYYSESDPTYEWEVNIGKSKYYSSSLNKAADAKVLDLAAQAQEYAVQNYPDSPVYGIVKYFDKWICENNYYNQVGVYGGMLDDKVIQETYYYCHSSYGILLKGYGVCESYALAMTRCLDAMGIPNMYATGQAVQGNQSGGHAWNYIQMPDGNWYLHDSTWNDSEAIGTSTGRYLLCGEDSEHIPMGNRYKLHTGAFKFVERSSAGYKPSSEKITLSKTEINLLPKKTEQLTYDSTYISNENIPKVWSSSNEKVAKVDTNGKVTAVGAGSAEITLAAAGMSGTCMVNVHQINSITFENGGKASLTTSCGIESGSSLKETQHILLTVNQKAENPVYTAEELNQKDVFDDFNVISSNGSVAAVTKELKENTIDLAIQPKAMGKTTITVTFGTKKATLNLSVSEKLNEKWFDITEVKALQNDTKLMYTGKAYKPKVTLTQEGKDKKVKFKVSYLNTKDAGTASVVITGTGTYGGELKYDFIIKPLVLNADTSSIKVSEKNVYNGGVNLTKSTVKHIDESGKKPKTVSLKAGKDYDIEYTKKNAKEDPTTQPVDVGTYTMKIVGKGNYAGEVNGSIPTAAIDKTWTIEKNDIKKVKVTVKVNGKTPAVTAAIGKNILPETDYEMTFYKEKACTNKVSASRLASKTQYFVKVVPKGSNIKSDTNGIIKSFKIK